MESKIDPVLVRKFQPKSDYASYEDSKAILYALGIGFNADPLR